MISRHRISDCLLSPFYTGSALEDLISSFFYVIPTETKPPMAIGIKSRPASYRDDETEVVPDYVTIQMAVAGCREDDIKVWCEDKTLIVQGKTMRDSISDKFKLDFKRIFPVSKELNPIKAEAKVEDGILTIKIPVADEVNNRTYILGGKA